MDRARCVQNAERGLRSGFPVCDKPDELPKEQYFTKLDGEVGTTVGEKWAQFQIRYYNQNAQPLYVLVDNNGKLWPTPKAKAICLKTIT